MKTQFYVQASYHSDTLTSNYFRTNYYSAYLFILRKKIFK